MSIRIGVVRTRDGYVLRGVSVDVSGRLELDHLRSAASIVAAGPNQGSCGDATGNLTQPLVHRSSNVARGLDSPTSWTIRRAATSTQQPNLHRLRICVRAVRRTSLSALRPGKHRFYGVMYAARRLGTSRLVLGSQATHRPSTASPPCRFSDAGAPETYSANNYVHLIPGDGEEIIGVCTFGNQLFVFKESKIFVFYGTATDSTGNPVFNYRTVVVGLYWRLHDYITGNWLRPSPDGVYFARQVTASTRRMAGHPVKVTSAVESRCFQAATGYSQLLELDRLLRDATLSSFRGKIFISYV
jgi:hypothetical protein